MRSEVRRFEYGSLQRWVLGVGGVVFSVLPGYSYSLRAPDEMSERVAIVLLTLMGLASLYVWWRILPSFELSELGVTRRRLGRRLSLTWDELTGIATRGFGSALVLRSASGSMRIESPLEGYGELFEAVRARRPDLLESDSPSFPVILRRRFGWTAWSVGLIAAGVVLCRYFATPLWSDASWNFTFVYRATFGVASFSLGAWMFCMSETKIVFTKNAIERHTPFFREALPVYRIVDVERSRDEHPEQGASQLLCLTWLSAQSHSEARAHVLVLDSMRLSGDLEAVEQLLADNYVWLDDDRLPDAA